MKPPASTVFTRTRFDMLERRFYWPDVAVEVRRAGARPKAYLFAPKYKLDSAVDDSGDRRPKKVDIGQNARRS